MNERIKELSEQSGAGWDDKYHWYVGNEQMKKFAELIVQECYVALKPMLRDMISRGQAFDLIKEHFGVE
jgi:hypothetical protein